MVKIKITNGDYPYTKVRLEDKKDGLCAIFYGQDQTEIMIPVEDLKERLENLNENGYDAPLTQDAIDIWNNHI